MTNFCEDRIPTEFSYEGATVDVRFSGAQSSDTVQQVQALLLNSYSSQIHAEEVAAMLDKTDVA